MRNIIIKLILICSLAGATSCVTMGVENPFRYDYELGVTFIVWYGDPSFYLNVQTATPVLGKIDFNPLYRDYMSLQNQKLNEDQDKLKTVNFMFSVDF